MMGGLSFLLAPSVLPPLFISPLVSPAPYTLQGFIAENQQGLMEVKAELEKLNESLQGGQGLCC